jgi:intracellular septation protein
MKQFVDFLPIIVFVGVYVMSDIFVATAALMITAAGQIALSKLKGWKISRQMWIVFYVALGSGTLTLVFQDKTFIQWKPTIVYWIMAVALVGSRYFGRGNYIQQTFGKMLTLPARAWGHLTWGWAAAILLAGAANLYVAYEFSEAAWVTYTLFSAFVIPIVLTLASVGYLMATGQLPDEQPEEVEQP